ncbi:MAG TPA: GNAT family N-acetyltransferase [Anaerolineae bacterium]
MLTIRSFDFGEADFEARVAISNTVWPESPTTVGSLKQRIETRDPNYLFQLLMVELDGQIVGYGYYGEMPWSHQPGKYDFNVTVHPDYERRGIGTAVYDYIMDRLAEREPRPAVLTTGTRENKAQAIRFLEKRGFEQVMRWPQSRLDVATFDADRFAPIVERVRAEGIQLYSLPELQSIDSEWRRHIYELDMECTLDEPSPDPWTPLPFEQYVKECLIDPNLFAEGWFVALDDGHYVGMTQLFKRNRRIEDLEAGFSAVRRSHRRRGIVTALKTLSIEAARRLGAQTIKTGNEENNPMYQINLRLGFKPEPASLAFKKKVQ